MNQTWLEAQEWERNWWGDCANTLGEELKQLVYAQKMGLRSSPRNGVPVVYDLHGASVLDIGGGPCSLLLKCHDVRGCVADPCAYPSWVYLRYAAAGIQVEVAAGEALDLTGRALFDEVWIYNVLQHVAEPDRVIARARELGEIIRLFEWIDMEPVPGHPHRLTEAALNDWLGGEGQVEMLTGQNGCHGRAYYGIFVGRGCGRGV